MPEPQDRIHLSLFADAFRESPAPTIILSADGLVLFWNPAAERAFGWTAEETAGKPLPFIPPEKVAEHRAMRRRDLEGEGFSSRHISRRRKDGRRIDLSVSTAPIRDAAGAVVAIISVYTDITAERREQDDLRERHSAAQREIAGLAELTAQLDRQRAELRLVIDGVPGVVAYIDRDYRHRYASRSCEEWFGIPAELFVGKTVAEVLGVEMFATVQPELDFALTGRQVVFDRSLVRGGRTRHVRATYVPDYGEDGAVRGVVAFVQDITQQRNALEALRASEERFRRIVEIAVEGIWMLDREGVTTFVNQRMADILGADPEEILGRPGLDFIHPEERARAAAGLRKRFESDTAPREYRCIRKDGATVWLDFTATPILDDHGEADGVLIMGTDITERKHADQQLRQTQKLESLGILAGGIAHDFNNLLVGMIGNASLALETLAPDTPALPLLRDVVAAGERAAQLTRQLLSYAGRDQRAAAPADLSAMVRELAPLLGASISKLVRVELDLDEDLPPVLADPAQLQQVIMNLVINGAEAVPSDTPGTVTVTTELRRLRPEDNRLSVIPIGDPAGEYVSLRVHDTGAGMDHATQSRIFDPFYTTKFEGRGLGLSAVLGIVRGHNGTVTLESAPGDGSTFTVLLPAAPGARVETAKEPAVTPMARGKGTILVVDDEQIVREMARRALEHAGYRVVVADNGRSAIQEVAGREEIRAVLLDLAMPEMSGDAAAAEMRTRRPELPILLSSGYNEREATARFASAQFSGFLQKPYTVRALLEKLSTML